MNRILVVASGALGVIGLAGGDGFRGFCLMLAFVVLAYAMVSYWLVGLFDELTRRGCGPLVWLTASGFATWLLSYSLLGGLFDAYAMFAFLSSGDIAAFGAGGIKFVGIALASTFLLYTGIAMTVLWRALPWRAGWRLAALGVFVPAWMAVHWLLLDPFGEAFDLNPDVLRTSIWNHFAIAGGSAGLFVALGSVLGLAIVGVRLLRRGEPSEAAEPASRTLVAPTQQPFRRQVRRATLALLVLGGGPLLLVLVLGLHPNGAAAYRQHCQLTHSCWGPES